MAKSSAISLFATPTTAVAAAPKVPANAPAPSKDGSFEETLKSARKQKPGDSNDDAPPKAEKPATKKPAKAAKAKRSQASGAKDQAEAADDADVDNASPSQSSACDEKFAVGAEGEQGESKDQPQKDAVSAAVTAADRDQSGVAANGAQLPVASLPTADSTTGDVADTSSTGAVAAKTTAQAKTAA